MCGQSVWERLKALQAVEFDDFTPQQESAIFQFYKTGFKKGELKTFCAENNLRITSVSRWARRHKLTNSERPVSDIVAKVMSERSKEWIRKNGHPRGMLGKNHSEESLAKIAKSSVENYAAMPAKKKQERVLKMLKTKADRGILITPRKGSWKQGWAEIGEKRCFFRSSWEFRFASYLEMLKRGRVILEWQYEPETFWFEGVRRGTTNYTPDFRVIMADGTVEFYEVKGWMDARSRTKIKRMAKYHPEVVLRVFDKTWFKANKKLC